MSLMLPALRGRNPLGLFAALGALDVATRRLPDRRIRLAWTDELEPVAVLSGIESLPELVELCDRDRDWWGSSLILRWGPDGKPLDDLKPSLDQLREWIGAVLADYRLTMDPTQINLLSGLVAEGAAAGKGDAKPTHFHFTAGQQKFLLMVRQLQAAVTPGHLAEALTGPWTYTSELPVFDWDARGERIWALRGPAPSGEKKRGVPGADWLAFLGLRFFPVALASDRRGGRQLVTTGCTGGWKAGHFTWPLWSADLSADVVSSVLADQTLWTTDGHDRTRLGLIDVMRAPIRRSDQGGYGSFGPPSSLVPVTPVSVRSSSRPRDRRS